MFSDGCGFSESLEQRQLLAGDVFDPSSDDAPAIVGDQAFATTSTGPAASPDVGLAPQGEPQIDLVQFAKDLDAAGVIFYGADWCPFCNSQKELFSDGAEFLPFVEVTNADHSLNAARSGCSNSDIPNLGFPSHRRRPPSRVRGVDAAAAVRLVGGVHSHQRVAFDPADC